MATPKTNEEAVIEEPQEPSTHYAALTMDDDKVVHLSFMDISKTLTIVVEWDLAILTGFILRAMNLIDQANKQSDSGPAE